VSAREPNPSSSQPSVAAPACHDLGSQHCITCSDEGTPMRVLALDPRGGSLARCAAADGLPVTVETALVAPLGEGAIVLVHAGVALAQLDAEWGP
jgi:hydrogenase maturation factor